MTKMATMPIYGENYLLFSPEPRAWWPYDLVCRFLDVGITKFVQMLILSCPWPKFVPECT